MSNDPATWDLKVIIPAIALIIILANVISNWVTAKAGFGKDIKAHEKQLDKHDKEIEKSQTLKGCEDWRKEFKDDFGRVEKCVGDLREDQTRRAIRIYNKIDAIHKEQKASNKKG